MAQRISADVDVHACRPGPTSCCQRLTRSVVSTDYAYDTNGNRLTKTSLAGTANAVTETWTYTPTFNQVATFKNGLNYITTFTYDTLGLLREVKDPLNNITTFTYNSAGQPLTVEDPRNKITTLTYDLFDLRSSKDPLNRIDDVQTDALGRRYRHRRSNGASHLRRVRRDGSSGQGHRRARPCHDDDRTTVSVI